MPNIGSVGGPSQPSAAPVQPSSSNPSVAGNIAQSSKTTTTSYQMSTGISSLGALKAQAPDVYNLMMQGIATQIITDMQASQARLEQMWSDARDDA